MFDCLELLYSFMCKSHFDLEPRAGYQYFVQIHIFDFGHFSMKTVVLSEFNSFEHLKQLLDYYTHTKRIYALKLCRNLQMVTRPSAVLEQGINVEKVSELKSQADLICVNSW